MLATQTHLSVSERALRELGYIIRTLSDNMDGAGAPLTRPHLESCVAAIKSNDRSEARRCFNRAISIMPSLMARHITRCTLAYLHPMETP